MKNIFKSKIFWACALIVIILAIVIACFVMGNPKEPKTIPNPTPNVPTTTQPDNWQEPDEAEPSTTPAGQTNGDDYPKVTNDDGKTVEIDFTKPEEKPKAPETPKQQDKPQTQDKPKTTTPKKDTPKQDPPKQDTPKQDDGGSSSGGSGPSKSVQTPIDSDGDPDKQVGDM